MYLHTHRCMYMHGCIYVPTCVSLRACLYASLCIYKRMYIYMIWRLNENKYEAKTHQCPQRACLQWSLWKWSLLCVQVLDADARFGSAFPVFSGSALTFFFSLPPFPSNHFVWLQGLNTYVSVGLKGRKNTCGLQLVLDKPCGLLLHPHALLPSPPLSDAGQFCKKYRFRKCVHNVST